MPISMPNIVPSLNTRISRDLGIANYAVNAEFVQEVERDYEIIEFNVQWFALTGLQYFLLQSFILAEAVNDEVLWTIDEVDYVGILGPDIAASNIGGDRWTVATSYRARVV